jgi:acyl-CoA reductase-like NAD-dependent aldehyde dehydrogenase
VIAEYPLATAADVRLAIDAGVAAWPSWKKTPGPERGRVLWRAADIARRRIDEIASTLTREEGKISRKRAAK